MQTFPRHWPFGRGIHRSPVNSPHKGQWRGALMFSLICIWINSWVKNRDAGDLRRHLAHHDVTVMFYCIRRCQPYIPLLDCSCRPLQTKRSCKCWIGPGWRKRSRSPWRWSYRHSCQAARKTVWILQWRHNEPDGVSNHQPHDCLPKRSFRHISKKTSKLRVTGLCEGNSPLTGEFPAQRASNAENASIWWRHHDSLYSLLKIYRVPASVRHMIKTHVRGFFETDLHEVSWHFAIHQAVRPSGF